MKLTKEHLKKLGLALKGAAGKESWAEISEALYKIPGVSEAIKYINVKIHGRDPKDDMLRCMLMCDALDYLVGCEDEDFLKRGFVDEKSISDVLDMIKNMERKYDPTSPLKVSMAGITLSKCKEYLSDMRNTVADPFIICAMIHCEAVDPEKWPKIYNELVVSVAVSRIAKELLKSGAKDTKEEIKVDPDGIIRQIVHKNAKLVAMFVNTENLMDYLASELPKGFRFTEDTLDKISLALDNLGLEAKLQEKKPAPKESKCKQNFDHNEDRCGAVALGFKMVDPKALMETLDPESDLFKILARCSKEGIKVGVGVKVIH